MPHCNLLDPFRRQEQRRFRSGRDDRTLRRRVLLEVPVASVEDALAAQEGGADRLELNAALPLGGLTPSLGTLIEVKAAGALPAFAMIRPRPGGFACGRADFPVMQRDADLALRHGADGIVFGILTADGRVDGDRCRRLLRHAGDRAAVFHRALDITPDPFQAQEQLIDLGFRRVLTSGQEETASNGAALLAGLIRRGAGRIEVLPAGGINRFTVTIDRPSAHLPMQRSKVPSVTVSRPSGWRPGTTSLAAW
jgi:copper homeostasis protein